MIALKLSSLSARAIARYALLSVVVVSISACGFHLRGNIPLSDSVKNMYLKAPEGTFKDQLEDLLTNAQVELATSPAGADVVLEVTKALSDRAVGTLDDRGKVDSYDLRLNVAYVVKNAEGLVIRPNTSLVETRRYNFNAERVVESESEEEELLGSMEESISLRMLRQLSTITDTTKAAAPAK